MNPVELGATAFWLLMAAGTLTGAASLWAFRRWSNAAKLRAAVNRMLAHLLEFRLFADEPALILRAQRDLLSANWEFLKQLIGPSLLLMPPFVILIVIADAIFGQAPLKPGHAAVVTIQCNPSRATNLPAAWLEAPPGIEVETPPVRIPRAAEISWRVRPIRNSSGDLRIHCNGRVMTKSISAKVGLQWLSDRRAGSMLEFLLRPFELPFFSPVVKSISVNYPSATVLNVNWLVWFSIASIAGALVAALLARGT